MRGEILTFDETAGTGLISGDDGLRYGYNGSSIQGGVAAVGQRVDFVAEDGLATHVMILAEAPAPSALVSAVAPDIWTNDWQKLMLSFNGRARRSHFGIACLILVGASVVVSLMPLIGGVLQLALIWPGLAIAVKRLHDMGKSGWFVAIPFTVGVIGFIIAVITIGAATWMSWLVFENKDPMALTAVTAVAIVALGIPALFIVGFLLWIGLTPGQPGLNRFGNNPKGE